ncbi:hypothetical protein [Actinoplanes sp. NPDC049802]|uniref:hypothetical protein n=1 Tax=Actinoplanes sp. NPDC049802 TaxID=3154742 RepID=UPI0033E07015
MTSKITAVTRGRAVIAAAVAAVVLAAGGTWYALNASGHLLWEGPLMGAHDEIVKTQLEADDTRVLWGSLLLHNDTAHSMVLESVEIADNPGGIALATEPYLWDTDRVALLGTGAVAVHPMPLPSDWKIPPKHAVAGFVISPHAESESVEVLFELQAPPRAATVSGITVTYRTAGWTYRNTYNIQLTICPSTDLKPCA